MKLDDFSARLRWARENAEFDNPREAARYFEWNINTYKSHENGMRGKDAPPQATVRKYARGFKVDFLWLLTGEGSATRRNVAKVTGRIGAGAEIMPEAEQVPPEGLFEIEAPFSVPPDAIAFEVEGDSMWPRYDPGDVVVCWREGTNFEDLIGHECAVQTEDGKRYLKRVTEGRSKGLFTLNSHNQSMPIPDVKIVWSSRIVAIIRAGEWRRLDARRRATKLRKALSPASSGRAASFARNQ